jgi:hypothetical protein
MNNTNTGGPAFPVPNDANVNHQEGMTLRDYFAAKAMEGLLACPEIKGQPYEFATRAYSVADAMLKARDAAQ